MSFISIQCDYAEIQSNGRYIEVTLNGYNFDVGDFDEADVCASVATSTEIFNHLDLNDIINHYGTQTLLEAMDQDDIIEFIGL